MQICITSIFLKVSLVLSVCKQHVQKSVLFYILEISTLNTSNQIVNLLSNLQVQSIQELNLLKST